MEQEEIAGRFVDIGLVEGSNPAQRVTSHEECRIHCGGRSGDHRPTISVGLDRASAVRACSSPRRYVVPAVRAVAERHCCLFLVAGPTAIRRSPYLGKLRPLVGRSSVRHW